MSKSDQLFRGRKKATEASLKRRVVNWQPNRRILIVCEGEETEKRYFLKFVNGLDLKAVEVEVSEGKDGSAPISVVEYAERRALGEGLPEDGGYELVFCVFDRDTHESYERAKSKVCDLNSKRDRFPGGSFEAITSVPCFEIWVLYHFHYTRTPFVASGTKSPCECLLVEFKKSNELRCYNKALSNELLERLISNIPTAKKHARKAIKDAEATGEDNPSTLVFRVIECLHGEKEKEAEEAKKSEDHY